MYSYISEKSALLQLYTTRVGLLVTVQIMLKETGKSPAFLPMGQQKCL